MSSKPNARVAISEDAHWFEQILLLMIHYRGSLTFDPDDFKLVAGMSVVILPHEHEPSIMGVVMMKTEDARKVAGKPAKKGMH